MIVTQHARPQTFSRHFELPGDVYNATPPRVIFGSGAARRIPDEIARLECRRALVISTPGRDALARRIAESLGETCVGILPEAISQVPIELARKCRLRASEMRADSLVSVGGGASVGLAKAIALELDLPIVAVPTTYSGSEVTGFCGITIDGVKRMHTSLRMLASTIVYDPDLTLTLPFDVSAASALNALAHCVDAVYVPTVSPVNALAAAEGARVIADSVARLAADKDDPIARGDLLYGAYLGGVVLTGGFALQHGLAHTLGGSFGVAHGLSHALVLPHVAAYNAAFAPEEVETIAAAMGAANIGGAIFDLLVTLGLPTKLSQVGIREDQVPEIARITVETDNGQNPAPVTEDAVTKIALAAFHGQRPG